MARERLERKICDRCKRAVDEAPLEAIDETTADPKHLVYVEATLNGEAIVIKFDDLCKKCEDRSAALLKDLELSKEEKAEDEKPPKKRKRRKGADDAGPADAGANNQE